MGYSNCAADFPVHNRKLNIALWIADCNDDDDDDFGVKFQTKQ